MKEIWKDDRIEKRDGEIFVVFKKDKFLWEKTDKDYRHSVEYINWRTSVFERDDFICKDCGQNGGILNAHHKETFKSNIEKRYDINNGITLCKKCHIKRHKRRCKNG